MLGILVHHFRSVDSRLRVEALAVLGVQVEHDEVYLAGNHAEVLRHDLSEYPSLQVVVLA